MELKEPQGKVCRDCGVFKAATEFWRRKQSPDGLALYCKRCFGERNADSYRGRRAVEGREVRPYRRRSDVPEGMKYCPGCKTTLAKSNFGENRANKTGLADYCRPCHNEIMAQGKQRNHGSVRNYLLKLRYGITADQVDEIGRSQGGICAICLRAPVAHVDHDHQTGLFRGLLCFGCNGGLGQFRDEAWRLRRAAGYLDGGLTHFRQMEFEFGTPTIDGLARRRRNLERRTRADRPGSARHYKLRAEYGIDERDEQRMLAVQRGLCAICADEPGRHVDHDHETGAVRGVLCLGCNTGMGQFKDDPVSLLRAADYLDGFLTGRGAGSAGRTDPATMTPACRSLFRALDGARRRAGEELLGYAAGPGGIEARGLRGLEVTVGSGYPHRR